MPAQVQVAHLSRHRADHGASPSARYLALSSFLVGAFVWYGGGLVRASEWHLDHPVKIGLSALLFLAITLAVYFVGRALGKRSLGVSYRTHESVSYMKMVVCVAALLGTYVALKGVGGMPAYHSSRFVPVAGIIAAVLLFRPETRYKLVWAIILIATLAISVEFYSRRPFLTIAIVPIIIYIVNNPISGVQFRQFIVGLAASTILLIFMTGLRGSEFSWQLDQVDDIFTQGWQTLKAGMGFDTITLLDYVIGAYPDAYPYLNGKSLWGAIVNPLPRFLWEDKPISFGIELASRYFGVDVSSTPTNFGPGIVAEAYANGGAIMVALWAALLGSLLAALDNYISRNQRQVLGMIFTAISLPAVFFVIRGDLMNSYYELYIKAAPAIACYLICTRRVKYRLGAGRYVPHASQLR